MYHAMQVESDFSCIEDRATKLFPIRVEEAGWVEAVEGNQEQRDAERM